MLLWLSLLLLPIIKYRRLVVQQPCFGLELKDLARVADRLSDTRRDTAIGRKVWVKGACHLQCSEPLRRRSIVRGSVSTILLLSVL